MIAAPKTNFRIRGPPSFNSIFMRSSRKSYYRGSTPTMSQQDDLSPCFVWKIQATPSSKTNMTTEKHHFFCIIRYVRETTVRFFVMLVLGKDRMWSKSQPGVVTSSTSGNWRQVPRRKCSLPKEIGKIKIHPNLGGFPHEKPEKTTITTVTTYPNLEKNAEQWMILSLSFWKVFYSSNTSLLRNVLQNNLWHIKMLLQLQQLEHNHSSILPVE